MLTEEILRDHYRASSDFYRNALEHIRFSLTRAMEDWKDEPVLRIFNSSSITDRVKTVESLHRKVLRDHIELDKLYSAVEDILGIRIVTPNKQQARRLYEWFEHHKTPWFCGILGEPHFVPYTIEDRNKHSLRTGYQAFHVTFVADRPYEPLTTHRHWPCEIQIMSEAWRFWAEYSRKYFYAASSPNTTQFTPYNTAIAKLLDSADDLMVATTESLLAADTAATATPAATTSSRESAAATPVVTLDEVRRWLEQYVPTLGETAKVPKELFVVKLADDLNLYGVDLPSLSTIVRDHGVAQKYRTLLRANHVPFLPVYQQLLCLLLLYKSSDLATVLERVNAEIRLLGIQLHDPAAIRDSSGS